MSKDYKYKCRECPPPVRLECIQQARISPGIRRIIAQAFESHTDTQNTWDLLQPNCLLVQRDTVLLSGGAHKGGLLSRLQKQKEKADQEAIQEASDPQPAASSTAGRLRRPGRSEQIDRPVRSDVRERPVDRDVRPPSASQKDARLPGLGQETVAIPRPQGDQVYRAPPQPSLARRDLPELSAIRYPPVSRPQPLTVNAPGPRMLVAQSSGHRIALPEDDELVFGRFDPLTRLVLDVDLTFENRQGCGISRRHARISAQGCQYTIEDLGSSNGTWVNEERVSLESKRPLRVGDQVRLGGCVLYLDQVPAVWASPPASAQYFLFAAFTGRYFPLPSDETLIIGRADPALEFTPDIDLSHEGAVASVVSRRHARLTRRGGQYWVEDLGSANSTRIDGHLLPMGAQTPIKPGQHLWLGGCILAFDLIRSPETGS